MQLTDKVRHFLEERRFGVLATAQADSARPARRYHGANADRQIPSFKRQERVTIRMRIERAVVNGLD